MKRYHFFTAFCLLLIIGTVLGSIWGGMVPPRQLASSLPATCSPPKMFELALKRIGTPVLGKPLLNNQSCKPDWSRYGTCCNVKLLQFSVKRQGTVLGK